MLLLIPKDFEWPPFNLLHGSAIVADEGPTFGVTVYFEGNLYGAETLQDFWDRVIDAAGRLAQSYPVVARARVEDWRQRFDLAGRFDYERYRREVQKNQAALRQLGRVSIRVLPAATRRQDARAFESPRETLRRVFEPEPGQAARLEAWIALAEAPGA